MTDNLSTGELAAAVRVKDLRSQATALLAEAMQIESAAKAAAQEPRKVTLELVGLDGNALSVMGAWSAQARREGWTSVEIEAVLTEALSGDYNHLLATIMDHSESPAGDDVGEDEDGDEDEWPGWDDEDEDDEE